MEFRKIPFLVKRLFSREKEKETEKGKRAKSQRTKVEGRKSLRHRDCRINTGKGGLSLLMGIMG